MVSVIIYCKTTTKENIVYYLLSVSVRNLYSKVYAIISYVPSLEISWCLVDFSRAYKIFFFKVVATIENALGEGLYPLS